MRYNLQPPTTVDDANKHLHEYHADVIGILGDNFEGLVGDANEIEAVIVSDGITDDEKTELESWLGSSIELIK